MDFVLSDVQAADLWKDYAADGADINSGTSALPLQAGNGRGGSATSVIGWLANREKLR